MAEASKKSFWEPSGWEKFSQPLNWDKFTLAAVGDCIISQRCSVIDDEKFLTLVEAIRNVDYAFANLEGPSCEFNEGTPDACIGGATYICIPPGCLDDLKWMGFKCLTLANNHMLDYGREGLIATMKHCKARGIPFAGAGMNLGEARLPTYVETRRGRVALISASLTFPVHYMAGHSKRDMQGRPGINGIRYDTTYIVSKESIDALQKVFAKTPRMVEGALLQTGEKEYLLFLQGRMYTGFPGVKRNDSAMVGIHIVETDSQTRVARTLRQQDVDENIAAVKEARRLADWVIFSPHHQNVWAHDEVTREFYHQIIDSGADAVIASGQHNLEPIEIYKGKPIFYGLGDFFYQNDAMIRFPADYYEAYGVNLDASVADALEARGMYKSDRLDQWEAILPICTFDYGTRKLVDLKLYPVESGWSRKPRSQVLPLLAKGERGKEIIKKLQELSAPFGTDIIYANGLGIVQLAR